MGKSEYALSDNDRELYRPFSVVRQLSPASATALEFFFTSAKVTHPLRSRTTGRFRLLSLPVSVGSVDSCFAEQRDAVR